jgi:replication factor A1
MVFTEERKESQQSTLMMQEIADALKDEEKFIPIKELSMQSGEDWIIKVRITKKGKKIAYQTGCLFKIEMIDEAGTQIEGTFYKDCVDKFFNQIEEGKVYVITKGQIAVANKKFTSV